MKFLAKYLCISTGNLICLASSITKSGNGNAERFQISFPRLEANFVGTGDLFAALSIAWFDRTKGDIKATLEYVIGTMQAILKRTLEHARRGKADPGVKLSAGDLELKLVQSQGDILHPKIVYQATQL